MNGQDDDADEGIVALLVDRELSCTGTLVAPRVVLTAAHCLEAPPTSVYFGSVLGSGGEAYAVSATRAHPAFDPVSLVNDIGIVVLAAPAAFEPIPLSSGDTPLITRDSIRIVGFGWTGDTASGDLRKRSGASHVASVGATSFDFFADPAQTCVGDSGGPALARDGAGREVLVGVASEGDPRCQSFARDTLVSAYVAPFIAPAIAAVDIDRANGCSLKGPARPSGALALLLALGALAVRRRGAREE